MPLLVWDSQVPSIRLSLLRSPTKFHVNVEASIENATVVADGRVPVTAPPKFCMPPPEIPYRRVNVPVIVSTVDVSVTSSVPGNDGWVYDPSHVSVRLTAVGSLAHAASARSVAVARCRILFLPWISQGNTEGKQATPAQIALAWLLAQKPWIVPIPGTTKLGRLEENLGAAAVELSADDLRRIETAAARIAVHGDPYDEGSQPMIDR